LFEKHRPVELRQIAPVQQVFLPGLCIRLFGPEPMRKALMGYDAVSLHQRLDYGDMLPVLAEVAQTCQAPGILLTRDVQEIAADLQTKKISRHEYWQKIGGTDARWQSVTNRMPPKGLDSTYSPYNFKPQLYAELVELMAPLRTLEEMTRVERNAYHLAVMFSNRQEVERYLTQAVQRTAPDRMGRAVSAACAFDVPLRGLWDAPYWKGLLLKYGMAAGKYMAIASEIESYCRKNDVPLPTKPAELRDVARFVVYGRATENPEWAGLALDYGLEEKLFETGLQILQKKAKRSDNMPDIMIDGSTLGLDNYYMTKLPANDPRGLVLGHITNSCQSLGGNGEFAAVWGMVSPDTGFYVWKHKTGGKVTPQDRIVAESWAWLTRDRKGVVFDSYERLSPDYNRLARPFMEQFAYDLKEKGALSAVFLGAGGGTPQNTGFFESPQTANPAERQLKSEDSLTQLVVPPVNHRKDVLPPDPAP
ncbi:MAG: hypothetical protein KKA05_00835, partial [Alphaproteobacteria bacterium]|nr:hypothetical protein [Alphaproteobacteria bacterium]